MAARIQIEALRTHPRLTPYVIPPSCVRLTGKQLGVGSYGSVEELQVHGLVCAGKLIHEVLVDRDNRGVESVAQRYAAECHLLASLRHPHIVKFVGVSFLPASTLPLLIMERLDNSLDDLLTQRDQSDPQIPAPDIPLISKVSMMKDVVKGLQYLHTRTPDPIAHRDLSAKNVLLDSSATAKISDLGNSRFVSASAHQTLTQVPGTQVYMPPESLGEHSHYGPKLDVFSFGHLALYTLIQVRFCL